MIAISIMFIILIYSCKLDGAGHDRPQSAYMRFFLAQVGQLQAQRLNVWIHKKEENTWPSDKWVWPTHCDKGPPLQREPWEGHVTNLTERGELPHGSVVFVGLAEAGAPSARPGFCWTSFWSQWRDVRNWGWICWMEC